MASSWSWSSLISFCRTACWRAKVSAAATARSATDAACFATASFTTADVVHSIRLALADRSMSESTRMAIAEAPSRPMRMRVIIRSIAAGSTRRSARCRLDRSDTASLGAWRPHPQQEGTRRAGLSLPWSWCYWSSSKCGPSMNVPFSMMMPSRSKSPPHRIFTPRLVAAASMMPAR